MSGHAQVEARGAGEPARRTLGRRTRRAGLSVFFATVAVNAALGIYAVLDPDFGETQGNILLTSLCVTGATVIALACEPAWERGLLGPVPPLAAALGVAAFAVVIVGIWAEPGGEAWARVVGTLFTLALAGVVAGLLALARLAPRHAWVHRTSLGLLAAGAALLVVVFWTDDPPEWYVRATALVLIALAAFAVTVPVLHWVDRGAVAAAAAVPGTVSFCPYCGRELAGAEGEELVCPRCGAGFAVHARGTAARRE